MDIDKSVELMMRRGYEVHYSSGDRSMVSLSKHIESKNVTVHAEVYDNDTMVKLTCVVGLFSITSPKFTITHSRFEDLFEDKIIKLAYRSEYSTL